MPTAKPVAAFRIDAIQHYYRDEFSVAAPADEDGPAPHGSGCHNDVSCHPAWTSVSHSVARMNYVDGTGGHTCTGQLLAAQNGDLTPYFLTANHCIQTQFRTIEREKIDEKGVVTKEKVRISEPGTVSQIVFNGPSEVQRTSYTFKIKLNDSDLDLALIQVNAKIPNAVPAPIACRDAVRGETVYAVGNPLGVLYASVSKGIVASSNRNYRMIGVDEGNMADNGLTQATTPTAGGNSGGSLYNDTGEIVGVVVRGYQQIAPVNLSVPLADIKKFLGREKLERLWARCGA